MKKTRIFLDMDGTLCEWRAAASPESLWEKGYFATLRPIASVVATAKMAVANPYLEVFVMSSYYHDSKYARNEKNGWVDKYLPEINECHRIFVPYGEWKSDWVPGGILETDVLVDDYSRNLHEWKGVAVKCLNGFNGTNGSWKGPSIDSEKQPAEILENILSAAGINS